jgi:hypothetical protein
MLDQADDPSDNFAAKLTWLVHKETVTVAELLRIMSKTDPENRS